MMSRLRVLSAFFAVTLAVSCGGASDRCVMCGREECTNLAFTIHLAGGGSVRTCCPRCALRYLDRETPRVAALTVRDFETTRELDARAAAFVEGSDVHPCSADRAGPPKDERGCCMKTVYDRCLPSALAFADRSAAERFAKEHGGFVTSFDRLASAGFRPPISQLRTRPQ